MPRKRKPEAVCDGDTPLAPITAKQRKKIDKSIKKRHNRFRRRYPEVHGKVVDFITDSIEDGTLYFSVRFKDKTDFSLATHSTCLLLALTFATSRRVISR